MPKDGPKSKKQKRPADDEDDDDDEEEDEDFVGGDDDDDDDDDDDAADDDEEEEDEGESGAPKHNDKGEAFFDLSGSRRLTVNKFRNQVMIDLREYYEKDGKQLPGKKGLSLTVDQYETLKGLIQNGSLDKEIASLKKK